MKKAMKIILIILGVIILLVILGLVDCMAAMDKRNKTYYEYTKTGGDIEAKYTAMGELKTEYKEFKADDDKIGKYAVWYPKELESGDNKYPIVLWANGTGSKSETYKYFLTHLASWGFIAVGNDDKNTRTGESLEKTLQFLISENDNKDSVFYQKLDLDNIGIGGHSQGGPAVFNMVTEQEHGNMIKTVYAVSATSSYHTAIYQDGWEYDISKMNVPTFLTAGTGTFDAGTASTKDQKNNDEKKIAQGICPLWSLEENYALLPDDVFKIYARKKDIDHGETHTQCDSYMTAWFMYQLKGDESAGKAFIGDDAEILSNENWQDVQKNN